MNETFSINDSLVRSVRQLEYYKELCEISLDQCDNSFFDTKKQIIEDFDTLITYLTDRKIEILTQLTAELESHKQDLERNRDKANSLIQKLNKKISLNGKTYSSEPNLQIPTTTVVINSNNSNISQTKIIVSPPTKSFSTSSLKVKIPLSKSLSFDDINFKSEQLQILKEDVSVIQWNWIGEFLNSTVKVRTIKSETPSTPRSVEILSPRSIIYNSTNSESEIKSPLSVSTSIPNSASTSPSKLNQINLSSNNLMSSALMLQQHSENYKALNQYGKLDFKIKLNDEYKELKTIIPKSEFIYSIGGKLNGFDQYSLERYDFEEMAWRNLSSIPSMDNDFTSIYDGKNQIYLFGGSLSPTRVLKYSILDDSWSKLKVEIPDGGRFLHCTVFDGKQFVYLVGGYPKSTNILKFNLFSEEFTLSSSQSKSIWNSCVLYDENYHQSSNIPDDYESMKSSSNTTATGFSIRSNIGNNTFGSVNMVKPCIYLLGGCSTARQSVNTFERYDIEEDKFYEMPPLPTPMYSGGAVLDSQNGYIYVFGGFNSNTNECLSRVERFSIQTNKWEIIDNGERSILPKKLTISNSTFLDEKNQNIYIVGGYNPSTKEYFDQIFKFSLITLEWETSNIPAYQYSKQKGGSSIYISK